MATDTATRMIYENKIDTDVKRELKLYKNCTKAYLLFEGRCTKSMKAKLKSHANYVQMEASYEEFLLTRILEAITFKFEVHKHQVRLLHDAKVDFYAFGHPRDVKTPTILGTFKAKVSLVKQFGG